MFTLWKLYSGSGLLKIMSAKYLNVTIWYSVTSKKLKCLLKNFQKKYKRSCNISGKHCRLGGGESNTKGKKGRGKTSLGATTAPFDAYLFFIVDHFFRYETTESQTLISQLWFIYYVIWIIILFTFLAGAHLHWIEPGKKQIAFTWKCCRHFCRSAFACSMGIPVYMVSLDLTLLRSSEDVFFWCNSLRTRPGAALCNRRSCFYVSFLSDRCF